MTTSIQTPQQTHQYGSKASGLRRIWNRLTRFFTHTAEENGLTSHTSDQTITEIEPDNDELLFFAPQNFIDYAAEGEEPADLALADMVPSGLALLNLPSPSLPADMKNSLSLAPSNSTQYFKIDPDILELEELIPQGLSALAQAPVHEQPKIAP